MSGYRGPDLLASTHRLDRFDCGDEALNNWQKRRALRNQGKGSSRTWVVADDTRVVAYYASSTAAVTREQAPDRIRRNQPVPLPAMSNRQD